MLLSPQFNETIYYIIGKRDVFLIFLEMRYKKNTDKKGT